MKKTLSDQIAENPTQFNIAAIAKLEEEALGRRTHTERQSDAVVRFIGSTKFLLLHEILVAAWSTVNLNLIPGVRSLQMLQKLCQHAGVDVKSANQQVQGFSETTDVQKLASELEEKLPER